jgi:hypothetical protein
MPRPLLRLLALLAAAPAAAADLFVAPDGVNDNAPGRGRSLASPYRTIDYAADRATPGATVHIRGGVYRETITPAVSGTAQAPITFRPWQNEEVVVTGLDPIVPGANGAGQWQADTGGVFRIQLSAAYGSDSGWGKERQTGCQVFVDGVAFAEARWPDAPTPMGINRVHAAAASFGSRTLVSGDNTYTFIYGAPGLGAFPAGAWTGGLVVYAAGANWYRRAATIDAHTAAGDASEIRFTVTPYNPSPNRENPQAGDPFFLMGRRAALDSPGEAYFDTLAGPAPGGGLDGPRHTLYLRLPGDASPAGRQVEMRRRGFALLLDGVSHLRFENLRLLAGRIKATNTTASLVFSGLTVDYGAYTWAEELGDDYNNVLLEGAGHQFLDGLVRFSTGHGIRVRRGSGHLVRNTVIHDCFLDAIALHPQSGEVTVEHCTVFDTGTAGISADARPSRVLRSHGQRNALFATDIATLNAGSNIGDSLGSEWAWNWMHDALGVRDDTKNWYGTPAIRLDAGFSGDGPSNYLIHHNLVWNTTQPETSIALWALRFDQTNSGAAKIRLYNNTTAQGIGLIETFAAPASIGGFDLRNNLSVLGLTLQHSSTTAQGRLELTDAVLLHNFFPNRTIVNNPTPPHLNNRRDAAGFSSSTYPEGFLLRPDSAAIDAGAVIPGITDGHLGAAPDVGALESGLPLFIPGAKLRLADLAELRLVARPSPGGLQLLLHGLPRGRSLPDSFRLRVGDSAPLAASAQLFDLPNSRVGALFQAGPSALPGGLSREVRFSLDGLAYATTASALDLPPPALVRAAFADGSGGGSPDRFPGAAGEGWAGPWSASSLIAATVPDSPALSAGSGRHLRAARTGGSGSASQEGVFRAWNTTVLPDATPFRLAFDFRAEFAEGAFNATGDNYTIALNNLSGATPGNHSTIYLRAFGAASGPLAAREWGVFNGVPGATTGYDINRFRPTGLVLRPGVTYRFTLDVHQGSAAGQTAFGRTVGTYDVTISDGVRSVTVTGSGFRSASYAAGPWIGVTAQQDFSQDNLAFSLDDLALAPLPSPLALWRAQHFAPALLADPSLEPTRWGPLADPDGDGLPNLLEYALDQDPLVPASEPNVRITNIAPALSLSFLRARAELTYIVEASSTLAPGSWTVIATNPGAVSLTVPVAVTDTVAVSTESRRFLRLRVQ